MMSHEEPSSGLPWLNKPVMLHSSREDVCKLTPEQCAYRSAHWRYWYQADRVYGQNTIYFLCATVGAFAIAHLAARFAPGGMKRSTPWRKGTAIGRYLAYRGFRVPLLGYCSPSLGVVLLILAGVVFFFAMTLGPRPYYWPNTETVSYGSSPPLATRAGWMALGLLPFVLVLSAKANMVTALTGVPHEKLQVFHHWTSYAMFVLALVHTFPFIVKSIRKGEMEEEWRTSVFYWTGVAALIPQAYLTFMSLPPIRNRYYEFFKASHFVVALLFLLFLFFHCNFRLSSWDYFIAGGSLYLLSLLASLIHTHLITGRHTATLDLLDCGLLRIKIPTITTWRPGQHIFIRFLTLRGLGLHTLTAHPFTICSTAHNPDETGMASEMVFYVKPKKGITGRLGRIAERSPGSSHTVLLEGPYGGLGVTASGSRSGFGNAGLSESGFDSILIISGGSGGGFTLPVLEDALQSLQTEAGQGRIPDPVYRVIFSTRSPDMARWYGEEISSVITRTLTNTNSKPNINISIHITSPETEVETHQHSSEPKLKAAEAIEPVSSDETNTSQENRSENLTSIIYGRPDIPRLIASGAAGAKRTAVFACGPASMLHDVRNAAATEQERILRGGSGEVYLHCESFSW